MYNVLYIWAAFLGRPMQDTVITARVSDDTLAALRRMGQEEDRTLLSYLVRKALEQYVGVNQDRGQRDD